ncbi:hypothetical protein ACLESO_02050 [Pyxidicoccus sp. 3LG]
MKPLWVLPLALFVACAPGDEYLRHGTGTLFARQGNSVWVRGPWSEVRPSRDVDEVIDQLCPALMKLPRATDRDYGQEYCGAIYSLGDGLYYASHGSPLGKTTGRVGAEKRKACIPPSSVVDERGRTATLADYHSHPWAPSPMSVFDFQSKTQLWTIRIQFDSACTIMKYIPYLQASRPGEVYVRRENRWRMVGRLMTDQDKELGIVTAVDEAGD